MPTPSPPELKIVVIQNEDESPRTVWSKIESASKALAIVALPLVLAVSGYFVQHQIDANRLHQDQNRLAKEYLELATRIVQNKELVRRTDLKNWAQDIIRKFSPVPVSPGLDLTLADFTVDIRAQDQLVNRVQVGMPSGSSAIGLPNGSFIFQDPAGQFYYLKKDDFGNNTLLHLSVSGRLSVDDLRRELSGVAANQAQHQTLKGGAAELPR